MLKAFIAPTNGNGVALDKLLVYFRGLKSVEDEADVAVATANLESIRRKRAEAAAEVEGLKTRLEKSESDAADALAAGRGYDERALKTAHQSLSNAESQLRVLSLAVVRAEQQIPDCERAARERVLANLRAAHAAAVKDLNDRLAAAAAASSVVRLIELEARRLLGHEQAAAAGIRDSSWDDLLETENGHVSRLAEWRLLIKEQAGIQL
jgi:hypothetical protein